MLQLAAVLCSNKPEIFVVTSPVEILWENLEWFPGKQCLAWRIYNRSASPLSVSSSSPFSKPIFQYSTIKKADVWNPSNRTKILHKYTSQALGVSSTWTEHASNTGVCKEWTPAPRTEWEQQDPDGMQGAIPQVTNTSGPAAQHSTTPN